MNTHYSNIFHIVPGGQGILYQNYPTTHFINGFPIIPHGQGNIPQQNHPYTHYPNGFPNVPGGQRIPYHTLGYQVENPVVYHYSLSQVCLAYFLYKFHCNFLFLIWLIN